MTKSLRTELEEQQEVYDTDIDDDDYGFIVGPDGELKTVFLPADLPFKTPKNVQKILKIFGVKDPEQFNDDTLH